MDNVDSTVLDHVDSIRVPGRVFENPANEYWALVCLRDGLEFLYRQAASCDDVANKSLGVGPGDCVDVYGNDPALSAVPKSLLTSAFHWYAVSACQYVRTIGAIAIRNDPTRPDPPHYVASVIPEVLAFRDKVAAHFAWTMKHSRDNDAEREHSIMPQLAFIRGSFHVGGLSLCVRRGGNATKSAIIPWSICDVHSRIRERYWPEQN